MTSTGSHLRNLTVNRAWHLIERRSWYRKHHTFVVSLAVADDLAPCHALPPYQAYNNIPLAMMIAWFGWGPDYLGQLLGLSSSLSYQTFPILMKPKIVLYIYEFMFIMIMGFVWNLAGASAEAAAKFQTNLIILLHLIGTSWCIVLKLWYLVWVRCRLRRLISAKHMVCRSG